MTSTPQLALSPPITETPLIVIVNDDDKFTNSNLAQAWKWIDPGNDSTYSLTSRLGFIRISTPNGNDLAPFTNMTAPRLLQPISGNFDIRTLVEFYPQVNYQGAGLLVWV